MGLVGFLSFAVIKCVDDLAWPLFPLGYPLYASIRFMESSSRPEAQKLVAYWIILSLILLFEHAFSFQLIRLPTWRYVRLLAFCFLAIPNFGGAFYIYNLLVRRCLSFDPKMILQCLSNLKDSSMKSESFLDAAERYLETNGHEALENLIANMLKHHEQPDVSQMVIRTKVTDSKAAATAEQTTNLEPEFSQARSNAIAGDMKPNGVLRESMALRNKVQTEWTCAICLFTTSSEQNLVSHLQGEKHKSMERALEKPVSPNMGPSGSKAADDCRYGLRSSTSSDESREKRAMKHGARAQQRRKSPKQEAGKTESALWCGICKIWLHGETHMASHVKGRKHLAEDRRQLLEYV